MIEITQEELNKRLKRDPSLPKIVNGITTGNGSHTLYKDEAKHDGKAVIDPEARGLVAGLVALEGRGGQRKIANTLGVGIDQIHNIVHGKNWDGFKTPALEAKAKAGRESVADLALTKLQESLGLVTEDRLRELPVQEIVDMSQKMSVVIRNITGDQNKSANIGQVVLLAPGLRDENKYDVMTVEAIAR